MSPAKQSSNRNISSANSATSASTDDSASPKKNNKPRSPAASSTSQSQSQSQSQPLSPALLAQSHSSSQWSTATPSQPKTHASSSSPPTNIPYANSTATNNNNNNNNNNSSSSSKSHHHSHHHHPHHHHHSASHREPRPSNSNRRASSNNSASTALRHQHQQAQARAHAHVQAQLQAQVVQAHQLSYYQQHMSDLATYITQVFLPSVLPTPEEYQIKEQTRQYLETLADRISKGARLLPFGSIASGLALRNSDMDLCYLAEPGNKIENKSEPEASATDPNRNAESRSSSISRINSTEADGNPHSSTPHADQDTTSSSPLPPPSQPEQQQEDEKEQKPKPTPAEMVMILGKLIQEETAFTVKMLPKARIPIIKLSLPPSLGQPFGLSCDIGFENRLALENTRLLLTYAMVDPRMRTMVLFLKVWSKRRRINDPYLGTLSSYGYVLMVIYYLVNGRKAPVLPNLQQLPPPRVTPPEESVYEGHDIYFFDDLDALPRFWVGMNRENVGELLIEFFRFFSSSFRYTHDVISVRTPGGLLSKESKGWMHDIIEESKDGRGGFLKIDLNRLCIEDPFQTNYNVARTVTRDGLFTIRGEFMRAVRVLSTRTDRLDVMIRELCEERQEGVLMAPPSSSGRRKSAPNPKAPSLNMSLSGSITREEEEEDDDLEEQLLLQQQQQALLSAEQQPSYPPLTTRLMQDHIYSQATSSMDARPRYPPESIASEPPPLDRDLDWNHESISGYLSNEIQQLQLQQQQLQQPLSHNHQSLPHPVSHVTESFKTSSKSNTNAAAPPSAQHYFHRFFQTAGTENWNPQPSTSSSLHQPGMNTSPAFFYDSELLDPGLPLSPTSIPKHSGARRPKGAASDISRDDLESNSRGPHASTSKSRYNSSAMNSGRPSRSMSHSTMNNRRRSEQPQSSNPSMLNSTGPPIIMSSNGRMPDFSLLPLPGPIRFGNFGTTERPPKQKFDNPQRGLGRSVPAAGYYHHTNGYPSTSFQQDLNSRPGRSVPQDMVTSQRADGSSEEHLPSHPAYQHSWQGHDVKRDEMFLTATNDSVRRRSLSNGAASTHSSPLSFDPSAKLRSPHLENEEENRPGLETPRARSSQSPTIVGSQPMRMRDSSEHSGNADHSTSPLARCMPSTSSLSQLPRKIVFGDVEVSTETAKEVRVKALAAVLRTRRMGSLNSHSSRRSENAAAGMVATVLASSSSSKSNDGNSGILEGRGGFAGEGAEGPAQSNSSNSGTQIVEPVHSRRSSSARSQQQPMSQSVKPQSKRAPSMDAKPVPAGVERPKSVSFESQVVTPAAQAEGSSSAAQQPSSKKTGHETPQDDHVQRNRRNSSSSNSSGGVAPSRGRPSRSHSRSDRRPHGSPDRTLTTPTPAPTLAPADPDAAQKAAPPSVSLPPPRPDSLPPSSSSAPSNPPLAQLDHSIC